MKYWKVHLIKEGVYVFDADACTEEEAVEAARAGWEADEGPEAELWDPKVKSVRLADYYFEEDETT